MASVYPGPSQADRLTVLSTRAAELAQRQQQFVEELAQCQRSFEDDSAALQRDFEDVVSPPALPEISDAQPRSLEVASGVEGASSLPLTSTHIPSVTVEVELDGDCVNSEDDPDLAPSGLPASALMPTGLDAMQQLLQSLQAEVAELSKGQHVPVSAPALVQPITASISESTVWPIC